MGKKTTDPSFSKREKRKKGGQHVDEHEEFPSTRRAVKEKKPRKFYIFKPIARLFSAKNRRLNLSVGALLLLLSVYFLLSFISYCFTWKVDQSVVVGKGFFEFIFNTGNVEIANHLGKFGAWIAHQLMFKWFGLPSLFFPFLCIVLGVFLLLGIRLLPLEKTIAHAVIGTVLLSICFGFFTTDRGFPYGGAFGYEVNVWLKLTLGKLGAFLLLLVTVFITTVSLFYSHFQSLLERWAPSELFNKGKRSEKEDKGFDIQVVNPIEDDQIKPDEINEGVTFIEETAVLESASPSAIAEPELEITPVPTHSEGEVTTEPAEEEESAPAAEEQGDAFKIEVPDADATLSDQDVNAMVEQFGEYDPKLDLSSYRLPTIDLLNEYGSGGLTINKEELEANKNRIVEALGHYKIEIAKIKATVGPTVTLYEIVPAPGIRISKIKNLSDDIALNLAANGIRIIAPIPGKGTIGIEVPNSTPDVVAMRAMIASEKFQNTDMELPVVLGRTISNETFIFDLAKAPHLLCAGATGQGKSVGINTILVSLLYKKHPAQVKFVMVDPKKVELTLYNKIERHFLAKLPDSEESIITDTSKVVNTMNSLCIEMDDRYELLKNAQVRNIREYNKKFSQRLLNPENGHRYLTYIVVVIDEFADLIMTAGKEIEYPIARLAQLARAIGIHLIVATQRPSVNVITGMIKANFPARIAFRVSSKIDSRTILDAQGADQLIGRGDMLISFGNDLIRLQCAFVDTPEVEAICDYIGHQPAYPDAMILPEYVGESEEQPDVDLDQKDALFEEAARILVTHQQGSASLLQRKLKIGFNRAGRIIDQMEKAGVIGAYKGSKAREVIIQDMPSLELFLAEME